MCCFASEVKNVEAGESEYLGVLLVAAQFLCLVQVGEWPGTCLCIDKVNGQFAPTNPQVFRLARKVWEPTRVFAFYKGPNCYSKQFFPKNSRQTLADGAGKFKQAA